MATSDTLLEVNDLNKTFSVPVLKSLSFSVVRGEVHALMGSNGAGKSTLCNIIAGVHQPTSGEMMLKGNVYQPESVKVAEACGIRMVMQELNLFPSLSVAENLCFTSLGAKFGVIDRDLIHARARAALSRLGLDDIDPDSAVGQFGVGQQQLIEIASVLAHPVELLILDEPTAALTAPEIELLFGQIRRLRDAGVGIIYISHRMDEISRISDRVSILRDGQVVATEAVASMNVDRMVALMAGQIALDTPDTPTPIADRSRQVSTHHATRGDLLLSVEGLTRRVKKPLGGFSGFDNVSVDIYAGEVLGIGGLIGSGRTELLRAIFGADVAQAGCLRFAHDNFAPRSALRSPAQGIAAGIGMVVEDRKSQGLFLSESLTRNISFGKIAEIAGLGSIVDTIKEDALARIQAENLAIKFDDMTRPVTQLSGGNQQKAMVARWLLKDLPILLFDEPSRGVDASAKALIQTVIRTLAGQGHAVVVVSSETQELLSISDRVLVMSNGRVAGEYPASDLSETSLVKASFKYYSTTGHAACASSPAV